MIETDQRGEEEEEEEEEEGEEEANSLAVTDKWLGQDAGDIAAYMAAL
jgi:hypothetical protein